MRVRVIARIEYVRRPSVAKAGKICIRAKIIVGDFEALLSRLRVIVNLAQVAVVLRLVFVVLGIAEALVNHQLEVAAEVVVDPFGVLRPYRPHHIHLLV